MLIDDLWVIFFLPLAIHSVIYLCMYYFICLFIYIFIYSSTHMSICLSIHSFIYLCVYTWMCLCVRECRYVGVWISINVRVCVSVCVGGRPHPPLSRAEAPTATELAPNPQSPSTTLRDYFKTFLPPFFFFSRWRTKIERPQRRPGRETTDGSTSFSSLWLGSFFLPYVLPSLFLPWVLFPTVRSGP